MCIRDRICALYPRSGTQDCSACNAIQGPAVRFPRVDPDQAEQADAPGEEPLIARCKKIVALQTAETLAALEDVSRNQASSGAEGMSDLPDYEEFSQERDDDLGTTPPGKATVMDGSASKGEKPIYERPSRASSSNHWFIGRGTNLLCLIGIHTGKANCWSLKGTAC